MVSLGAKKLSEALAGRMTASLPGRQAQFEMAALGRPPRDAVAPNSAVQAGVLALFYRKEDVWHLVYIERQPHHGQDAHRGQISFPGGKLDPGDQTLEHTALRETEEEIGVPPNLIKVVGKLTNLYIPVSNFNVHPYVGISQITPKFTPDITEVRDILEIPVQHLLKPLNRKTRHVKVPEGFTIKDVPYFDLHGKVLWGATAMMTNELLTILRSTPKLVPYL